MDAAAPTPKSALSDLLPAVYAELKHLASRFLAGERPDHTLQPTALVHEAWLRLAGPGGRERDRAHFLAAAAVAMRRILVDHARRRGADRRGGRDGRRSPPAPLSAAAEPAAVARECQDVLELDGLLGELAALDPRKARVVELRFFADMTLDQMAEALGVARSTVAEDWTVARAWLAARLSSGGS